MSHADALLKCPHVDDRIDSLGMINPTPFLLTRCKLLLVDYIAFNLKGCRLDNEPKQLQ